MTGPEYFDDLFKLIDRYESYLLQPYSLIDQSVTRTIRKKLTELVSVSYKNDVKSLDEIIKKELVTLGNKYLELYEFDESSEITTPDLVMRRYSLKPADFEATRNWLLVNREEVIEANRKMIDSELNSRSTLVNPENSTLTKEAEPKIYSLIELISQETLKLGAFKNIERVVKKFRITLNHNAKNSSINKEGGIVEISTRGVMWVSDGKLLLNPVDLILDFGHEVAGHGANYLISDESNLPFAIKNMRSFFTSAIRESVCDYFSKKLYESLKSNPLFLESVERIGCLENVFGQYTYREKLRRYYRKLNDLGLYVLATSRSDEFEKQISELSKYSIDPKWPNYFINRHKGNWIKNSYLAPSEVSKLRYAIDDADTMASAVKPDQLPNFENKIRTGNWTREGFSDWVSLEDSQSAF